MNLGDALPSCPIKATSSLQANLSDYHGQWLILYFYPKDSTPGCTIEGQDFRDQYQAFQSLNAIIFGISRDSLKSHEQFKTKQAFPFELISDTEETLCQAFDVIKMKSMYGKQVRGIERSTFLFDPTGKLCHIWRGVKVKGHVDDVLNALRSLHG
ncbi:peroxiredoxin [Legionella oakridgensis]|uniref:thioredoxin-dependent peroxiredoxin n=2 Tax=Legionella oakridgensis TaxID=29423 RepID=W0BEN4_9GAMM|nr:peroxiredoxin [Legionella oakridgensis]AHE68310.1 peroxiredoxin [Legionella oakridgensis ATCC 33761 = DSM 21215]ETO92229.1 peroxiredoxin [Legionella oakridgensis RV-2-2007]KTD39014.1 peroxiredoxin, AhpC/TSA family protein [Legionella oakridgensis]STY21258.1 peroxiredoxin, AhpC/TSA family protein [Legionella longbeachae]